MTNNLIKKHNWLKHGAQVWLFEIIRSYNWFVPYLFKANQNYDNYWLYVFSVFSVTGLSLFLSMQKGQLETTGKESCQQTSKMSLTLHWSSFILRKAGKLRSVSRVVARSTASRSMAKLSSSSPNRFCWPRRWVASESQTSKYSTMTCSSVWTGESSSLEKKSRS